MSRFAFAAAGTGGHVFPALAVAAELERSGVPPTDIFFLGGSRMEKTAVPDAGYDFVELPLQGLKRSLTPRNLTIPLVVVRATRMACAELRRRGARVLLATGGYVTVPAAWAARRARVPVFIQEQNAIPGLANRLVRRWAQRVFLAFPAAAARLPGEVTGNPIRRSLATFDRDALRTAARRHYGLGDEATVLGVVGGSLGAAVLNRAVADLVAGWSGPPLAVVHLVGPDHAATYVEVASRAPLPWRVLPFEDDMARFYAAADAVVARGGGITISELAVTGTPALLVAREAATDRHQAANATELVEAGAAEIIAEAELSELPTRIRRLVSGGELAAMAAAAAGQARPDAATMIARAMREAAGDA